MSRRASASAIRSTSPPTGLLSPSTAFSHLPRPSLTSHWPSLTSHWPSLTSHGLLSPSQVDVPPLSKWFPAAQGGGDDGEHAEPTLVSTEAVEEEHARVGGPTGSIKGSAEGRTQKEYEWVDERYIAANQRPKKGVRAPVAAPVAVPAPSTSPARLMLGATGGRVDEDSVLCDRCKSKRPFDETVIIVSSELNGRVCRPEYAAACAERAKPRKRPRPDWRAMQAAEKGGRF